MLISSISTTTVEEITNPQPCLSRGPVSRMAASSRALWRNSRCRTEVRWQMVEVGNPPFSVLRLFTNHHSPWFFLFTFALTDALPPPSFVYPLFTNHCLFAASIAVSISTSIAASGFIMSFRGVRLSGMELKNLKRCNTDWWIWLWINRQSRGILAGIYWVFRPSILIFNKFYFNKMYKIA